MSEIKRNQLDPTLPIRKQTKKLMEKLSSNNYNNYFQKQRLLSTGNEAPQTNKVEGTKNSFIFESPRTSNITVKNY